MKKITILGSTGSIGQNALRVIAAHPERFSVYALAANANIAILKKQIERFKPQVVAVTDPVRALKLKSQLKGAHKSARILAGFDALVELAGSKSADAVLVALSGSCALRPLLAAIDAGRHIAMANKEAMVAAGGIITRRARKKGVKIIPVDSEHNAIFQCVNGHTQKDALKRIYLTGSGGPLRKWPRSKMRDVTPAQAINHPKWKMGRKISVDSATLMNKGLEVIEAKWLFGVYQQKIEVLIHPEAVVHSMVEFIDGSIIAQLGATDMKLPITYAFSYPERLPNAHGILDFSKARNLNFERPDLKKFPCLELAYDAADRCGTAPCVLNAANEELVKLYLGHKIKFTDIPKYLEKVLKKHRVVKNPSLNALFEAEAWARSEACFLSSRSR